MSAASRAWYSEGRRDAGGQMQGKEKVQPGALGDAGHVKEAHQDSSQAFVSEG